MNKCIFQLFKKVWDNESRPDQWKNTKTIQVYKGKGESDDLNNHRNIHTKDYLPKAFETIVVEKSKAKIVHQVSKFQIGAIPGHRSQEHLFVLKSTMTLYNMLGIALILQFWDLSKYFDKESLRDGMDALYQACITGKLYRLWFELNRSSNIKRITGVGPTNEKTTFENITQGSVGGGLLSALNLDNGVRHFFN